MENLIVKASKRRFDFNTFYKYLAEYKEKYGNLLIPAKYEIDGYKLGTKVSSIRSANIHLNDDQIKMLDDLGFVWDAKSFDFDKFYRHLVEYKKKYGNLLIPAKYEIDGYKLGKRINNIRSGKMKLDDKQIKMLNDLGFVWDAKSFDFNTFCQYLVEYKEKYGNLLIPFKYEIDGYKLGKRINNIRSSNIKLDDKQIKMLNDLGFVWDAKSFDFDKFYRHLVEYKKKYGNLLIPAKYEIDGYRIGPKINQIRSGKMKLDDKQIKMLNDLGFVWDAKSFDFDTFYNYLVEYKEKYGDLLIPFQYEIDGYKLGKRINSIRTGHIKLDDKQIKMLNDLGFVWNARFSDKVRDFDFENFYNCLIKFKEKHGHLFVKYDDLIENYEIGFYVRAIRSNQINLTMVEKRILSESGFLFDTHDTLYPNDNYSTDDKSEYLTSRMLDGDMQARRTLIEKMLPRVTAISKREGNRVLRGELYSHLSENLIDTIDRFSTIETSERYINKTLKYTKLQFYKTQNRREYILSDTIPGTDDLTIESALSTDEKERPDTITQSKVFNSELIEEIRSILSKSEFKLLSLTFGINTKKLSLKDLSEHYNVDEMKIKKAVKRILLKIKTNMDSNEWNV